MGFPWARVNSPKEVLASPVLKGRRFFTKVLHPELGREITYGGAPYRSSRRRWHLFRAPLIGEHNSEVYGELGIDDEELRRLRERGVI